MFAAVSLNGGLRFESKLLSKVGCRLAQQREAIFAPLYNLSLLGISCSSCFAWRLLKQLALLFVYAKLIHLLHKADASVDAKRDADEASDRAA